MGGSLDLLPDTHHGLCGPTHARCGGRASRIEYGGCWWITCSATLDRNRPGPAVVLVARAR